MDVILIKEDYFILDIKVRPNASQTEIRAFTDEEFIIALAAPADKEKANKELLNFLSTIFGVQKDKLSVTGGQHSSRKKIRVSLRASIQEVTNMIAKCMNKV
ncbi:TIGR00251 family protein [Vittaforma corneae ATCC 50505]|uniref:TIGR00251 family protein n=1 Tax=Vittaforma corneae (strain ATCC 50505) TaxID=993615 RepID=L2GQB3_VITCO|nr:TIGR00251 family protein [Vittaforma corneae ATCC 50505]ELA42680.1 TIGR00251 family protein [Vittaforma corneae ATCC 50505]